MGVTTFAGLAPRMNEFIQGVQYEMATRGADAKGVENVPGGVKISAKSSLMAKSKAEIRVVGNDIQYTYGSSLNLSLMALLCLFFFTLIAVILYVAKKGSAEDIALSAGQAAAARLGQATSAPQASMYQ